MPERLLCYCSEFVPATTTCLTVADPDQAFWKGSHTRAAPDVFTCLIRQIFYDNRWVSHKSGCLS